MNTRKTRLIKIICLLLIGLVTLLNTSCKKEEQNTNQDVDYTVFPDEVKGMIKDKNIYITSIGQDAEMIKFQFMILEQQTLFEYTIDSFLDAKDVEDNSIIFVFVGCSIKTLTENGTTLDEEMERAEKILEARLDKNLKVIAIHTGGEARRGSTSDRFIEKMFANSDFNIYVEDSNFDNFISNIAYANSVPTYQITTNKELTEVVNLLYGE